MLMSNACKIWKVHKNPSKKRKIEHWRARRDIIIKVFHNHFLLCCCLDANVFCASKKNNFDGWNQKNHWKQIKMTKSRENVKVLFFAFCITFAEYTFHLMTFRILDIYSRFFCCYRALRFNFSFVVYSICLAVHWNCVYWYTEKTHQWMHLPNL